MRKFISTISVTALILSNVTVALAETNTVVTNAGTGLVVNSNSSNNTNVAVTNTNTAVVEQTSHSENISGMNNLSGNISLGAGCSPCGTGTGAGSSIVTGAATSATTQNVTANSNNTGITLPGGATGSTNNTDVTNTGANVVVNSNAGTNTNLYVGNSNTAVLSQSSYDKNVSGKNTVTNNIGGGQLIGTGAAASMTSQNANVNGNSTMIVVEPGTPSTYVPCNVCGGFGGGEGNNTVVTNTGYGLNVNTNATTNFNLAVVNSNLLVGSQRSGSYNVSGKNHVDGNIGGLAGVMTGPSGSLTTQNVSANRNQTAVVLGADSLPLGGNFMDAVNTGANVVLNGNADTNTNVATLNDNTSILAQSFWGKSVSGYNASTNNIGGTLTGTGVAGAGTLQGFTGNSNMTFFGSLLGLFGWGFGWL